MAVWIFLLLFFTQAIAEKRILLNDPALVQSQVHALERKMEDVVSNLTAKYNDLNTKYTDQSVKYTELSTKYIELSTKYTEVSTKYTEVSTKYTDLSTKYSDQSIKLTDLSAKYANFSAKYNMLTNSNAGGIFIRWGRTACPGHNTELVYSGFAGGSYYGYGGSAAEFVCLPRDPDLTTKFSSNIAFMYGAEYDSTEFGYHNGDDLPCSVCRSSVQSSVMMIPGKSSCYGGWSMQYKGDLVAGNYANAAASQYICLDEHPETLTGGRRDENGKLFYPVKAVCGSLPCPPYQNGRYLSCVVCTM